MSRIENLAASLFAFRAALSSSHRALIDFALLFALICVAKWALLMAIGLSMISLAMRFKLESKRQVPPKEHSTSEPSLALAIPFVAPATEEMSKETSAEVTATTQSADSILLPHADSEPAPELKVTKSDWNLLIRKSHDAGSNSLLASQVLKKTALILESGSQQVLNMRSKATETSQSAHEMNGFSSEIRTIAKTARLIAFNLRVEGSRQGPEAGAVISVVARQMGDLSESTSELTKRLEEKIASISTVAKDNDETCVEVGNLFARISSELSQFTFLMNRIEALSVEGSRKITGIVDDIYGPSGLDGDSDH